MLYDNMCEAMTYYKIAVRSTLQMMWETNANTTVNPEDLKAQNLGQFAALFSEEVGDTLELTE